MVPTDEPTTAPELSEDQRAVPEGHPEVTAAEHQALADQVGDIGDDVEVIKRAVLPKPVSDLDVSLVSDVAKQVIDLVSTLDAALEQNPAEAEELKGARRSLQEARIRLELALQAAGGATPWQNKREG